MIIGVKMAIKKLAIDFDSVYTNIYMLGGGLVLSEPTVAAVAQDGKREVKAVGDEAKKLMGKTAKNTKIVFPVDNRIIKILLHLHLTIFHLMHHFSLLFHINHQ